MGDEPTADPNLLATLVCQVIAEQGGMRDDMRVSTAIAMRRDNTLAALSTEVRAMHARHARLDNRVRALESRDGRCLYPTKTNVR